MNKKEIILAVFTPAQGALHTPVQVQKLLFLIDKEIPHLVDGPHFSFQPYYYGPFDQNVYDELVELALENYVDIVPENTWNNYRLTEKGQKEGTKIIKSLERKTQKIINIYSEFVRALSFEQLVSAIYKAYPEMKVNSVFRNCE